MSNDPNISTRVFVYVKNLAVLLAAIYLAAIAWFQISGDILNDFPDSMSGSALLFIGAYGFVCIADGFVENLAIERAYHKLGTIFAIAASGFAVGAMIEFALHGAPGMTWPMQNEWRAHFVALGVFVFCVNILIPPVFIWLTSKMSDHS